MLGAATSCLSLTNLTQINDNQLRTLSVEVNLAANCLRVYTECTCHNSSQAQNMRAGGYLAHRCICCCCCSCCSWCCWCCCWYDPPGCGGSCTTSCQAPSLPGLTCLDGTCQCKPTCTGALLLTACTAACTAGSTAAATPCYIRHKALHAAQLNV
jgi:hypothetical protein